RPGPPRPEPRLHLSIDGSCIVPSEVIDRSTAAARIVLQRRIDWRGTEMRSLQHKRWVAGAVAGVVAIGVPAIALASREPKNDKQFQNTVRLGGALPFSQSRAKTGHPTLTAEINSQKAPFSVQDGDLKVGNGPGGNPPSVNCADHLSERGLAYLNSLDAPAM